MSDAEATEGSATKSEKSGPKTWWQWLLVYPTLVVAVISAAPLWKDLAFAFWYDTDVAQTDLYRKQAEFWSTHQECTASSFQWVENPEKVKVDATICGNGNIFVRIRTPDNRTVSQGIYIDDLIKAAEAASGISDLPQFWGAAYAAAPGEAAGAPRETPWPRVAQNAQVECQSPASDGRHVVRRIRVADECFDETVDTFTGVVTETIPVNCAEPCQ
ncbi:MAG: hypothetical protein AAFY59_06925 [Pseudomonadota bacterium]